MNKLIDGEIFYDVFYSSSETDARDRANEYLKNGAINKFHIEEDQFSRKYNWVLWVR